MKNKGKSSTLGIILGCTFAVAIVGFAVTSDIKGRIRNTKSEKETVQATAAAENDKREPEITETKPVQAVPDRPVKKQNENIETNETAEVEESPVYVAPTDGKISVPFSENPIYSKTFDDYRSHLAIDIDAAKTTPVKAISDGKIEKIYTDPLYGITIEIRHSDELMSRYCGLSSAEMVKEGDDVKAGDVISGIGTGGAAEKEQSPHLHLEIILNGEKTDPMDYLS